MYVYECAVYVYIYASICMFNDTLPIRALHLTKQTSSERTKELTIQKPTTAIK